MLFYTISFQGFCTPFPVFYSIKTISKICEFVYQMITLGGDAELELVDSLDPFSEGIVFR